MATILPRVLLLIALTSGGLGYTISSGNQSEVTIGGDPNDLRQYASIVCIINGSLDDSVIRWRHGDELYNSTSTGRMTVFNSQTAGNKTALLINPVSYEDNGTYFCEIRKNGDPQNAWSSARVELKLLVHLEMISPHVTTYTSSPSSELTCDMAGYVPPNSSLRWYRNETMLTGSRKYSIVYRAGSRSSLKKGGDRVSESVMGVLIISSPSVDDSGVYECRVNGYSHLTKSVQLSVRQGTIESFDSVSSSNLVSSTSSTLEHLSFSQTPPTTTPTTSNTSAVENSSLLFAFVLVVVVMAVLIAIASFALFFVYTCNRKKGDNSSFEEELEESQYAVISEPLNKLEPQELVACNLPDAFYSSLPMPAHLTPSTSMIPPLSPLFRNYEEPRPIMDAPTVPLPSCHGNVETSFNPYGELDRAESEGPPLPPPRSARRRSSLPPLPTTTRDDNDQDSNIYDHIYIEPLEPSMLGTSSTQLHHTPSQHQNPLPYAPIYDTNGSALTRQLFHISPKNVQILSELGHGHFGKIYLAATVDVSLRDLRLSDDLDKKRSILVAVKQLSVDAVPKLKEAFHHEIKFMSHLQHANVVRLLAVSMSNAPFIMIEYMENGDLNEFLRQQDLSPNSVSQLGANQISSVVLLYITVQIASGMRYLANKRFIHRDLAARNCLVGRDFITKISDFGMSRRFYESNYYRVEGELILPIRWMATETYYGRFSVKSDVWAFGVTVWEVFTLCRSVPYSHLSDDEVIADAIKGEERQRLPRPLECPQEMYTVLERCFVHCPSVRADFEEIYSRLFVAYMKLAEELR